MKKFSAHVFFAAALMAAPLPLFADDAKVPVMGQAPDKMAVERPVSGMSMDAVKARFGEPVSTVSPVGQPPIARWVYQDYTVYFENQTVIHSVLNAK